MAAQQATASSAMMSSLLSPMLWPIQCCRARTTMVCDFAHVGFTAEIPLPNQDFPSRFLARRVVAEHRLARLVQLGMRQSRYFGRAKTEVPAVPGGHGSQRTG